MTQAQVRSASADNGARPHEVGSVAASPDVAGLTEIEVSWSDQFGHALGKRIPVRRWAAAQSAGVAFCNGSLAWNAAADVQEAVSFTNWSTGYPDAIARPDLATFRRLPWRDSVGHVLADVTTHDGEPLANSPRAVLRRVIGELAARGYAAQVALELEFYLLTPEGKPAQDAVHCYSLEKADELEPALTAITGPLREFTPVEAVSTEYGPGQVEVNLSHTDALTAADDAFRLRYGLHALARRNGLVATFMAKPFTGLSGNSSHVHVSLWRDGRPAFAPVDGTEPPLTRHVVAGVLDHLPGITLYGSPTLNSYKRFEPGSFAPTTAVWGGDNRTVAVRSLLESPEASRIEVRTPAADANPYWVVASVLAAVVAGLDAAEEPAAKGSGNLYGTGPALPATLLEAVAAARADHAVRALLGDQAAEDFAVISESEWTAWSTEVTSWERDRYLRTI
jgi:glutamine synthetase